MRTDGTSASDLPGCYTRHVWLADTGVSAGRVQVARLVDGSDAAGYVPDNFGEQARANPMDPVDLADARWNPRLKRDRFEAIIGASA